MSFEYSVYSKNGIAIEGYDPVSFFTEKSAVKGKDFHFIWSGKKWLFTSQKHLDAFISDPEKYVPQYGGYCAFGISSGYKAKPKMDAFTIHEGRLYLNFANYVKERWLEKVAEKVQSGDQHWINIHDNAIPIKANRHIIYLKYKLLKILGKDLFK